VNCSAADAGSGVKLVSLKFTGTAPLVTATVKDVLPTGMFPAIVAVRLILLGVLLACTPKIVRAVSAVIFILLVPSKNVADPLPLVVERVSVILVVFVGGFTVAVMVAVLP